MFWKKKKPPKFSKINSSLQVKAHIREFILDTGIPDAHSVALQLGCVPISDEIAEREEDESEKRSQRVEFLVPMLYGYAALFAEATVAKLMPDDTSDLPPGLVAKIKLAEMSTRNMLEESMAHLLMGAVSQLVDLEFLEVNSTIKSLSKGKDRHE